MSGDRGVEALIHALQQRVGPDQTCLAYQRSLADAMGYSVRGMQEAQRRAVALGEVEVQPGGYRRANRYRLLNGARVPHIADRLQRPEKPRRKQRLRAEPHTERVTHTERVLEVEQSSTVEVERGAAELVQLALAGDGAEGPAAPQVAMNGRRPPRPPAARPAARRARPAPRPADALYEVLVELEYGDGERPVGGEAKRVHAAARELARREATAELVRERAGHYMAHWPGITFTAHGLLNRWAVCARPPATRQSAADQRRGEQAAELRRRLGVPT